MQRYVKIFLVIGCLLLLVGTANAQYIVGAGIQYDARYYPQLYYGRGGAEGHSGAYIQIHAGVIGYDELRDIRFTATHETGFIVSLREDDPSCVGVNPWGADQYFSVRLRAEDWWMKGEWEITMEYRDPKGKKRTETTTLNVPRFNFPPVPTGIEVLNYQGTKYVVWNRIGDPSSGPGKHVQYQIMHYTSPPRCIDDYIAIRSVGPSELWSGNRIAVPISGKPWNSGDLIRIENRVVDDNAPDGPDRMDRACKYVILP